MFSLGVTRIVKRKMMTQVMRESLASLLKNSKGTKQCEIAREYQKLLCIQQNIEEISVSLENEKDTEMIALYKQEIDNHKNLLSIAQTQMMNLMVHEALTTSGIEEEQDDVILEVRAGTGGSEASLFAKDLLFAYEKYCLSNKWKFSVESKSEDEQSGIKDVTIEIFGKESFSKLRWESGVHRVQRIPKTESQGRVHTSTVTVAVLPMSEKVQVFIKDSDLRLEFTKSSGPGGQHVNKTNSAVRLTHVPSGIVILVQEERSAQQNKTRALEMLKEKLFDNTLSVSQKERRKLRSEQIGSAMRSEKIRTYNFPQGRITDHRLGISSYNLIDFYNGQIFHEFIEPLKVQYEEQIVEQLLKDKVSTMMKL